MSKADLAETITIAGVTWSDGSPRVRLRRDREPSVLVPVACYHLDRLDRSLSELQIAAPMRRSALKVVIRQMVVRNRIINGMVYIQASRGVARRDHAFPVSGVAPALVMTAYPFSVAEAEQKAKNGVAVLTVPDIRWGRCDIKSTSLLANVLAKQEARAAGGYEAWLVDLGDCPAEDG